MRIIPRRTVVTIAVLALMVFSLLAAAACSNSSDETVDLLKDPKFGLSHLNDEFHTIKELLTELSQQVQALQQRAQ